MFMSSPIINWVFVVIMLVIGNLICLSGIWLVWQIINLIINVFKRVI